MYHSQNSPQIALFPRRVGPANTLVGVNLQWVNRAPIRALMWVNSLRISTPLPPDKPHGTDGDTPSYEETRRAHELFTSPQSPEGHQPVLAGSVTSMSSAEWFFYSADPCADELAEALSGQFPALEIVARSELDPGWSIFCEFLMPSPLERHLIHNRRSFQEAVEEGFAPGGLYIINHILWFYTSHERYAFAMERAVEDFELHYPDEDAQILADLDIEPPEEGAAEFGLTISRIEDFNLESLDELVARLFKSAARADGNYEGWHAQRQ